MGLVHLLTSALALSSCVLADGLADAMRAKGRSYIGTALTLRGDNAEEAIIANKNDFNAVTPENAMKWDRVEPNRGNRNFDAADRHVDWAIKRGYQINCHNLIYASSFPGWVANGKWSRKELIGIMKDHISATVGRYKGKCTRWEVVNEALSDDGSYKDNVFYRVIGEDYIPLAFYYARAADPHVPQWYTDYNLEYNEAKTEAAQRIVKLVQGHHGAKISGVGFQGHLASERTPTSEPAPALHTLEDAFSKLTSLGVDVAYTEMDVRMNVPSNANKDRVQAAVYRRMGQACLHNSKCVGMTLWGVTDKYPWYPRGWVGEGNGYLWDNNYKRKRAYHGLLLGIQNS